MSNLILQLQASVDGFVARTNGSMDWAVWNFSDHWTWDESLKNEFNRIFAGIDGIVLSGHMGAQGYIDHWTGMANEHKAEPQFAFAQQIADVPKFILSASLKESNWKNTTIINGDLAEEINALKQAHNKNLITFGGATFGAALLQAGLVDEIQLFVNPAILGSGISVFKDIRNLNPELISSQAYACGVTVLKYRLSSSYSNKSIL
jgi:dihydrofolate reductase